MDADERRDGIQVVIRIGERLGPGWAGEFDGLVVQAAQDGTQLAGRLPDQAALLGVLARLQQLNLRLIEARVTD